MNYKGINLKETAPTVLLSEFSNGSIGSITIKDIKDLMALIKESVDAGN